MSAAHDRTTRPTDEAAMAEVLSAESDARAALEEAARQAAALVEQAHGRTRAIAARAARRIAAVRAAMERRLESRLAEIEALERAAPAAGEPDRAEHARLEGAVERQAAELTREDP